MYMIYIYDIYIIYIIYIIYNERCRILQRAKTKCILFEMWFYGQ